MEHLWTMTGRWISRHALVVFVMVVAVTAVLAIGAGRLDFETGQDSYLEPSSRAAKDNHRYQELFGGENMVVMFTMPEGSTVVDLFTPANLQRFESLNDVLHGPGTGVEAVITPVTALQWTQNMITSGAAQRIISAATEREPEAAAVSRREEDIAVTFARAAAAGEASLENPDWLRFLLFDNTGFSLGEDGTLVAPPDDELAVRKALLTSFPDPRHALVIATVRGNASLDDLTIGSDAVEEAVAAEGFEGADVMVTGTPTFLTDINDYLQGGMFSLGAIALAVMVIVLLVVFRVRWRLLPLLAVILGIVWGFGVFGFLSGSLTLVTIAGLPILIGIGVEFAIQIHNRVEEECVLDVDVDPFAETLRRLGPPMVVATVSAVIAFLVMRVSRVPMIQDFGVLLATGIVMLLVTGIIVPLAVLGARERRSPTTRVRSGVTERILHWLGSLPGMAAVPLVLAAGVLAILGVYLESGNDIESDPINWANQSSDTIRNARRLENEVEFATTLGIFIDTSGHDADGVFTDEVAAFTHDFVNNQLEAEQGTLVQASSLVSTVASLIEVPGTTSLAPTGTDLLEAYTVAPPDIQRLLIADNANSANVLFQVGPSSLEYRSGLVDRIEMSIADPEPGAALLPSDASATPAGLARVGVGLFENLTANRAALTIVSLLLVAAFLVFRYGDWVRAALTMVPILLAVGGSATLVSLLDITLSPLTTVSGPLVVATCAEFSSLLTGRYVEGRLDGLSPRDARMRASQRTGRAFIASALTTVGGFAVLMLSSLPLLRDFGAIVTVNISVAVLSALVVVPPLAVFADERGWFRPPEPIPHHLDLTRPRLVAGAVGAVLLAVAVLVISDATRFGDDLLAAAAGPLSGAPATLPPPTTATTTTTTTTATTPQPGATTTTPAAPETLPPGPPERPTGLVAGVFYDALTGAGVDPRVARCAADELIATTPEAQLLEMGIAQTPRPPEVDALLADAALACGVPQATLDQLAS